MVSTPTPLSQHRRMQGTLVRHIPSCLGAWLCSLARRLALALQTFAPPRLYFNSECCVLERSSTAVCAALEL